MKWFKTFSLVMKSNVSALREKFEDPERMLHQLIVDMEEELDRIRDSVAQAIADEIQLGREVSKSEEEAQLWLSRAEKAIRRGDDQIGEKAVEQKLLAEQHADTLRTEHGRLQTQTAKLRTAVKDLEDKVRQARHKRTLLLARLVRAQSGRRIDQALKKNSKGSSFAEFQRLERRVERSEAMSDAYDRLEGKDPEAESIAIAFDREEMSERMQKELGALRRRLSDENGKD